MRRPERSDVLSLLRRLRASPLGERLILAEKGSKDKLQALLLIDENAGNPEFLSDLRRLLELFDPEQVGDALADAQVACLAVSGDASHADVQSRGYVEMSEAVRRGFSSLKRLLNAEET